MSVNWLIGLMSVVIWLLLFWNLLLRSRVTELRRELRKNTDYWNEKHARKTRERI